METQNNLGLSKKDISIPIDIIPFQKRNTVKDKKGIYIHFFTDDRNFYQVIKHPDRYYEELKDFDGIISPDLSLYIDAPLILQLKNNYKNKKIGHYYQDRGIKVIPNVRWSDERSYDFCFDGFEKNSICCVSTLGCFKSNEDKEYFRKGLRKMVEVLEPEVILVHGTMNDDVFNEFEGIQFINYESWTNRSKTSYAKKGGPKDEIL